jgi:DNA-binding NarL/FixJ family response regulator
MTSEVREQQIDWRRTKVLELSREGHTRTEICQRLRLDRVTVHRDIQFRTEPKITITILE